MQTLIQAKMSALKSCFLKMLIHTLPLLIHTFASVVSTELVKISAKLPSGSFSRFCLSFAGKPALQEAFVTV